MTKELLKEQLLDNLQEEARKGGLSRRDFLRYASVLGAVSLVLPRLGGFSGQALAAGTPKKGGRLRVAFALPAVLIDPLRATTEGNNILLSQPGEFLLFSNSDLVLEPRVAESWEPVGDGSTWRFKIRRGIKFHDGTPLTAKDVVYTMKMHSDLANGGNALSVFKGVLEPAGVKLVDDYTVEFTTAEPNGNFPYLVSSDNYNTIIVKEGYKEGDWEKSNFCGCGPWRLEKYTPQVGVSYVRNEDYWDKSRLPLADRMDVTFYGEEQARVMAMLNGDQDILTQFSVAGGEALLNDPRVKVWEYPSAAFRALHLRTTVKPFDDKRVRRALALLADRRMLIDGLLKGKGSLGNDCNFAPAYPSTDTSVPQRSRNVEEAKKLMAEAGLAPGTTVELATMDIYEIPDLAIYFQNAAQEIGFDIKLKITDSSGYYQDAVPGRSPWLDATMGITDYGHRGVPNAILKAVFSSEGTWNSAKFENPEFDQYYREYVKALDLTTQRQAASKIQKLLLEETPYVIPYFFSWLAATNPKIAGYRCSQMSYPEMTQTGFID